MIIKKIRNRTLSNWKKWNWKINFVSVSIFDRCRNQILNYEIKSRNFNLNSDKIFTILRRKSLYSDNRSFNAKNCVLNENYWLKISSIKRIVDLFIHFFIKNDHSSSKKKRIKTRTICSDFWQLNSKKKSKLNFII